MKRHFLTVIACLTFLGCYKETPPAADQVILNLSSNVIENKAPADGSTLVAITAEIPPETTADKLNLNFFTTKGIFFDSQKSNTTVTSARPQGNSVNRTATAYLVCTADTGQAVVNVSAQDITRSITIKFVPALPQAVRLTVDKQFITPDMASEATLTLTMTRVPGIPSAGIPVQFYAVDSQGKPVGNFRNGSLVKSDKTGVAVAYFSANLGTYLGKVNVTATVPSTSPLLSDQITLNIVAKN